jgi:hypothetical protein
MRPPINLIGIVFGLALAVMSCGCVSNPTMRLISVAKTPDYTVYVYESDGLWRTKAYYFDRDGTLIRTEIID